MNRASHGFSLIEVMVGLAVGLLAMLVMLQMLSSSQGQKGITMGGDDAQNSGIIALNLMQRDIRQGGFGINERNLLGCQLVLRAGVTIPALAPVNINPRVTPANQASALLIPPGDNATDTLLVISGNSPGATQGLVVFDPSAFGAGVNLRSVEATDMPAVPLGALPAARRYTNVWGGETFASGDRVIFGPETPATPCVMTLEQVTSTPVRASDAIPVVSQTSGFLYNLGPAPQVLAYAIRSGNLTVCDFMVNDCSTASTADQAIWRPIASHIVSLLAEFGRDNAVGDLTGVANTFDRTVPLSSCDWMKVSAMRLALVAQSKELGMGVVTAANPVWAGDANGAIDLSAVQVATGTTWQNYRYKLFETTVPLSNNLSWLLVRIRDQSNVGLRQNTGCAP